MRRTPLVRRTALRTASRLEPGKPLAPRSAKTTAIYKTERVPLVTELLRVRPFCQMNLAGCQRIAVHVHEVKSRARGGSILVVANCLTACAHCHRTVHDNPRLAHELHLSKHSWEP